MIVKREVRRVPQDWKHPILRSYFGRDEFKPLFGYSYSRQCEICGREYMQNGKVSSTPPTRPDDHMPEWTKEECNGYQMYETETAGTPISPVFGSEAELLEWLVSQQVGLVAGHPGTREEWERVMKN